MYRLQLFAELQQILHADTLVSNVLHQVSLAWDKHFVFHVDISYNSPSISRSRHHNTK